MATAIVTGGARGLGRVYCVALAGAGFDVVVADVLDTQEATEEIEAGGGRAVGVRADISSAADNQALAAAAAEAFGTIDVLINNAAFYTQIVRGPFHEVSQDEWDRAFEINVRGTWLACCAVYPYMKRQGSGKIINISSTTCFKGTVGFPHYVASKSAIVGLTRCLAQELGPDGITVNTVSPDLIPNPSLPPLRHRQRRVRGSRATPQADPDTRGHARHHPLPGQRSLRLRNRPEPSSKRRRLLPVVDTAPAARRHLDLHPRRC